MQSKCINLGQVLMDTENVQVFFLCSNCNTDIRNDLKHFLEHLEQCKEVGNFFSSFRRGGHQLKYNKDKCISKFGNAAKKEFLIYDYTDVKLLKNEGNFIDLMEIEEELLNPKWYSDLTSDINNAKSPKKEYDVLVEEVTPFVQFKDTVKSNDRKVQEVPMKKMDIGGTNRKIKIAKRGLSVEKICNGSQRIKHAPDSAAPTQNNVALRKRCIVDNMATSGINNETQNSLLATSKPETDQILNKLSNLGLQIRRTVPPRAIPPITDQKTLQILLKLQSKGSMKVKLINKQNTGGDIRQPTHENPKPCNNIIIRKVN